MIDTAIVIFYMIIVFIAGIVSSSKRQDLREYSLGRNQFSTMVVFVALFATVVGGGDLMGISEKVYSTGIVFLLAMTGYFVRDLLTAFFIIPRFDKLRDCLTVGDIMGKFYGPVGEVLVGLAGAIQATIIIGMQASALGFISNYFLGISHQSGVLLGMCLIIFYSATGGMRAVTFTDVFQFSVLIIAIPITFCIGMETVGGFTGLAQSVPPQNISLFIDSPQAYRIYGLFFVFMIPNLNSAIVQRILMSKNTEQAKKAVVMSVLARIPYYLMVGILGLVAIALAPTIDSNLAFPSLVNTILPVGIKGFVIAGILAVIMSTADSHLHISGLLISHNVIKPIFKNKLNDRAELIFVKVITVFIGAMSIFGALKIKNLIELDILTYAFWMPALCAPLLAGIMGVYAKQKSFLISALCGLSCFAYFEFGVDDLLIIDSILPAFICSTLVFFICHKIFGAKEPKLNVTLN